MADSPFWNCILSEVYSTHLYLVLENPKDLSFSAGLSQDTLWAHFWKYAFYSMKETLSFSSMGLSNFIIYLSLLFH